MKQQEFDHLMQIIDEIEFTLKENHLENSIDYLLNLRYELIRDHYQQNH